MSALAALLAACVFVPRVMWQRAEENRSRAEHVHLGQTFDEVQAVMRKPPEKREVRARFDGRQIEFWSYVSDYARKLDTTITFVDGRVTEIRATTWQEAD